jgi:hypothetical protein
MIKNNWRLELRDITNNFGENAGKIWEILNKEGSLKKDIILKNTKLKNRDFYSAIGWLARENKIAKDEEDKFRLDNTNLTDEIGADAGKLWQVMNIWGEIDISTMKKLADLDEKHVYCALGWLAREDKILSTKSPVKFNVKL